MTARHSKTAGYANLTGPRSNSNFSRRWAEIGGPPSINLNALDGKAASIAVAYWLDKAETVSGKHRQAAFETASRIREATGMSWTQIMGQQAAAEASARGLRGTRRASWPPRSVLATMTSRNRRATEPRS